MIEVNHSKIKETNRKKIIKLLLEKDEITKLDISRELDISITTVSTNISELKKIGIVEDVRSLESTGGRKAMAIKLNENCQYGLGIALTPRHVKLSLINLRSEDVELLRIRHDNNSIEDIINIVSYNIQSLLEKNNVKADQLLGIGISIPGTVDTQNGIIKNCYLLNIKDFNIKEKFEYLNVPIYVDNEANLSAYYEYLNKKDIVDNLLYVSITDGLGLGIIINGRIYRGSNNSSGEMGHMKINLDGKECKCGAKGCLEAYASKNAILDEYNDKAKSKISDIEEFEKLCDSLDEIALDVLKEYISILGVGISNLTMILDPNSIVIGGEINNLIDRNLNYLKETIYKDNLFTNENDCKVEITKFKESYLLGAARLPIEEFLTIK
ncbi:MAG: ROK family transcriptional regulator [Clostridium neonatale]|uniref:ROK family transcriptional regulator n=1 Tax=Clostridium neonatale TaxID=137838 RepID=UPI00291BAD58|nr:Xylose repressor XylR [Clostridium neonatale]